MIAFKLQKKSSRNNFKGEKQCCQLHLLTVKELVSCLQISFDVVNYIIDSLYLSLK